MPQWRTRPRSRYPHSRRPIGAACVRWPISTSASSAARIYGFLGPNGAGKSTTIRLLLDLIRPTSERAALLGLDSRTDGVAARRRLGYLPGDLRLYDRLTGREQLDSLARLRGMRNGSYREELVRRFTCRSTGRSGNSRRATTRSSASCRRSCTGPSS